MIGVDAVLMIACVGMLLWVMSVVGVQCGFAPESMSAGSQWVWV